jgi:putative zinc finger/helix-turn-helix YgiT family protein
MPKKGEIFMLLIRKEKKMCFDCMKEHEIQVVKVDENNIFKNEEVFFKAEYDYCENTKGFLESEEQIKKNDLAMKDAYREKQGLLTSVQIKRIRDKYSMSQKRFAETLGWGTATIIRYENHQVQDRIHDDVLRKIDVEPKWFMEMLDRAKEEIGQKHYVKSYKNAINEKNKIDNPYVYNTRQSTYNFTIDDSGAYELGFYHKEQYPSSVVIEEKDIKVSDLPLVTSAA